MVVVVPGAGLLDSRAGVVTRLHSITHHEVAQATPSVVKRTPLLDTFRRGNEV